MSPALPLPYEKSGPARYAYVSATRERVLEVSRAHASDLGLVAVKQDTSSISFSFTRWGSRWGGFELRVRASQEEKGQTRAVFSPVTGYGLAGIQDDLQRIGDSFADGVCSELADQGAKVSFEGLGKHHGDLARSHRRESFARKLYLGLVASIVPVAALAGIFLTPWWGMAIAFAFWILVAMQWCLYARWRMLGAKGTQQFVLNISLSAFALLATVIFVFVPRGGQ